MTAEIHPLDPAPGPGRMATPQLRTLVVCDIADSTALVERMGDQSAANIIRKHDRLARALIEQHHGHEIDKTDGFLLLFDRPIQAAAFALDYQRGLKHLSAAEGVVVRARVGIHMGDVVIWENAAEDVSRGAKPIEVEGLVKPVAARLAQLARPQQILMSSAAAGIAHRAAGELGRDAVARVRWKDHGRYRFKGLPEPIEVVEVGEDELAPLHAPKSGRTAKKILPWWRRPVTLVAEAAMLAIAVGIGLWFVLQSPPTLAFGARDWVVVGNVQNHTNQAQLGAPLDAAFKIGLEQSRYVNVIPDIQVQDTLKRMEKSIDTKVNRTIGSDIALREGARALILPSLAQVGGKVQISAEVVDPHTGVTVYSDSTQADGENQILPATDKLLGKLRGRLGESLASIEKTSQPLAQITTSNLEALRAFGQEESDLGAGKLLDAMSLLREAIRLDPNFAMAWARLGTIQLGYLGDPAAAYASLQQADKLSDRLSTRERLKVNATLARFSNASQWVERWSGYVRLYPDDAVAQYNLGMGLVWYEHRLQDALAYFTAFARSNSPNRGFGWYFMALVETELGKHQAALEYVRQGRKLGTLAPHFEDVLPDLAWHDDAAVRARLDAAPPALPASVQAAKQLMYAAVAVDEGALDGARTYLDKAAGFAAQAASSTLQARVALAQVAVAFAQDQPGAKSGLKALIDGEVRRASGADAGIDGSAAVNLALAAMLAARHGEPEWARSALDASRDMALEHGYYDRAALWRTADCEARFAAATDRLTCLTKLVDGREYFQTHVALLRTARAADDAAAARAQTAWLTAHRGQATAELEGQPALIPNLLVLRRLAAGAGARKP